MSSSAIWLAGGQAASLWRLSVQAAIMALRSFPIAGAIPAWSLLPAGNFKVMIPKKFAHKEIIA